MHTKYISSSPNAELLGAALLALVQNINAEEIKPLLARHGLDNIDLMQWYSEQKVLDLLKAIEEGTANVTENLVAIGMKAIETIPFPPEINSIEAFLNLSGGKR